MMVEELDRTVGYGTCTFQGSTLGHLQLYSEEPLILLRDKAGSNIRFKTKMATSTIPNLPRYGGD